MSTNRIVDWVQVFTGIAVLMGLVLVVWELSQTRDLTKKQIVNDVHSDIAHQFFVQMGEDFSQVYAKACSQPEELTEGEMFQMFAYHDYLLNQISRKSEYDDLGQTKAVTWEALARGNIRTILRTKFGHADFLKRPIDDPRIKAILDELVEERQPLCSDLFRDTFDTTRDPTWDRLQP